MGSRIKDRRLVILGRANGWFIEQFLRTDILKFWLDANRELSIEFFILPVFSL
jgi:hypothetical protein